MYLLSKNGKNGSGGVTGFESGGEWMCEKILLCALSIRVQGIVEYQLKFGGRGGRGLSISHECEDREFEDDSRYFGDISALHRGEWFTGRSLPRLLSLVIVVNGQRVRVFPSCQRR